MQKQHIAHFNIASKAARNGNKEYAIRYLQGMLRSAMSKKATKEIQTEISKYL